MSALIELKQQQQGYLQAAREAASKGDDHGYALGMENAARLERQVQAIEGNPKLSIRRMQGSRGEILTDVGPRGQRRSFTAENVKALHRFIASRGQEQDPALLELSDGFGGYRMPTNFSAAMYEGSNTAGGYAVPIVVDDQIVPLAPQEMAIRRIATVIPTTSDIKFPTKASFSVAALKTESSGSFGSTAPTLGQLTLTANMIGQQNDLSWELAQDVPAFQAFLVDDMLLAQQMYEEYLYCSGSGSGQPQGLIGNVATPIVREPDSAGNVVSISAILDLIGQLNEVYHANASFAMTRPTSVIIRKAQMLSNLFFQAFTSIGGQDYLFGYPVNYSAYLPAAARGNTPVLFGDFKRGYIIGDRGGSGINVKVLDQPKAAQGLITLLTYRRTDGRVRLPEAIQALTIAAS